ncbi:TPA: acetyl-CoA decarbonylase/synthase complex subunit gamma [Candidatus Poribacteria bacterium]|nr:acetyl-CoA decarbonylase/synthase complex subunit gamma [Candidatus Poribacteria bacterium]
MALTGLEIYKLLPRTNCGECGPPTCLAFAMQLAQKKASLDQCPYVSDEAKAALEGASAPPIKLVKIGTDGNELAIGNETVMFRHEETFHHPCGIAVAITDELEGEALDKKIEEINNLWFERVGQTIGVELIAIKDTTGDPKRYSDVVKTVVAKSKQAPILMSFEPNVIRLAAASARAKNPLIYAANSENYQAMANIAKMVKCPLAVCGNGLDEVAELTEKIKALGVEDLVIDTGAREPLQVINDLTQIRRLALRQTFRPLGYPTITFVEDEEEQVLQASTYISKYAGVVVCPGDEPWQILPLLTLRQNLYTDPRVPLQVEPEVYEVGDVTPDSPVLMTTNFSLTYFTVLGEVEASKVPAYILAVDTEGQSVLTAYASEKLTAEGVAKMLNETAVKDQVNHNNIIIPGYVAVMSGKLEEESGWKVLVGPREASALPAYLRQYAS